MIQRKSRCREKWCAYIGAQCTPCAYLVVQTIKYSHGDIEIHPSQHWLIDWVGVYHPVIHSVKKEKSWWAHIGSQWLPLAHLEDQKLSGQGIGIYPYKKISGTKEKHERTHNGVQCAPYARLKVQICELSGLDIRIYTCRKWLSKQRKLWCAHIGIQCASCLHLEKKTHQNILAEILAYNIGLFHMNQANT